MGGAALKKWWAVTYLRQMLVVGSLAVIRWASDTAPEGRGC
jgi:hypothetical protein